MSLEWFKTSEGQIHGKRYPSADCRYFAIAQYEANCNGQFERGRCWLFGPTGEIFSPPDTIRPRRIAVSNTGTMIVGDLLENTGELHSRITIFSATGNLLFKETLDRNCTQVAISPEGNFAIAGAANPNNCIYVIDIPRGNVSKKIDGYGWFNQAVISEEKRVILVDQEHEIPW